MSKIERLSDVIDNLSEFDAEETIYAARPWTPNSRASVLRADPETGDDPVEAGEAGLSYFLEIDVAHQFLQGWLTSLSNRPDAAAICARIIDYAVNDA